MTALGLRSSARLRISPGRRPLQPRFLPTRLPGLAFWFDAKLSPYSQGRWRDLSGNGNDALQATPTRQPSRTTDAAERSVLRFDGVNDALLVDSPPDLSGGLTLFVVYRVRTPVDFHGIVSAAAAAGVDHQQFFTFQYAQASAQRIQLFGRSTQANQVVVQGVDSTEMQYAIATFDDDGVDVELRDLNGIKGDASTAAPFGTPAALVLGARYNQGATFNFGAVDLYEVGLFNRELTPGERNQLESYLQQRHALAWNPRFIGNELAWFHDADASGFGLAGDLVDQWEDLTKYGRHWIGSGGARPLRTVDGGGRGMVSFDGIDDLLTLTAGLPTLQPFSVGLVYRVRERSDFTGVLSAVPPAGADHSDFWTFRNTSAAALQTQLFGRSIESDPLELTLADGGGAQVAVWSISGGVAELHGASGSGSDSDSGSFGAPTGIVLGGRYAGAPFGHAAIDVLATVGAARVLSTAEQQRLIAWATARWSL